MGIGSTGRWTQQSRADSEAGGPYHSRCSHWRQRGHISELHHQEPSPGEGEGKALCVLPLGATLSTHSEYCKTVSCRGNRNRTILK